MGKHILSASRRFAFLCMFLFSFFHFQSVVQGSISIINSGKTFHTKQDQTIGLQLVRGYEYMGRLQHIDKNPTLCSNNPYAKFPIVPPSDGIPVAIIAQSGGGCSSEQKIKNAARMISPKNRVQYIIIQDSSKHRHDGQLGINNDDMNEQNNDIDVDFFTDDDSNDSYYDNDINIAVLHVSYYDGQILLNTINSEDSQVLKDGGMRILLNSKELNLSGRTVIILILITVTVCACLCCCILAVVQSSFEEEIQQPTTPTTRPTRRRLTLEQVRSRFPAFHFDPIEHHQSAPKPNSININDKDEAELQQNRFYRLSDECTICLDEFTQSARCRQLPCGHVFHSSCIAKWLIERQANCPLCKLDLYEVVQDENSDGTSQLEIDSENQQSIQEESALSAATENDITEDIPSSVPDNDLIRQGDIDLDTNNDSIRRSSLSSRLWGGWTMNLFGHIRQQQRQQLNTEILTELTEPLVSSVEERPLEV